MKRLFNAIAMFAIALGLGMIIASMLASGDETRMFLFGAVMSLYGYAVRHEFRLAALERKQ